MSILIATPDFPPAPGGIQLLLHELASELHPRGVVVVSPAQDDDSSFDQSVPYAVVRSPGGPGRQASMLALNAVLPAIARRVKPRVLISGHIICGPGALVAGRLIGAPVLQYSYAMELTARGKLAQYVLPRAAHCVAISDHTRSLALSAGARPEAISVIPPGVAPPEAQSTTTATEPGLIVTVARLQDRYKGFDVVLRALPLVLARVPGARWVIVGDGPLRAELAETAFQMGIGRHVEFVGRLSDPERDAWLRRAAVFALASRVPVGGAGEGYGIAYLEAARFGVPSVAGAEGGGAEAVLDSVTGTLVDPLDHIALAEALCDLLLDPDRRDRYGDAARTRAAELSWPAMGKAVGDLLDRVVAG